MDLVRSIQETTLEIFGTMIMMEVVAEEPLGEPSLLYRNSISGMVGLAGTARGGLAVHVPWGLARAITGSFLGIEVEEINEDVQDAIGELANMLAGNIKSALSGNGKDIELSLPSTISGEEYGIHCGDDSEITVVPFTSNGQRFYVELQLERV